MKNKKYGYYKNRNTGEYEIMKNIWSVVRQNGEYQNGCFNKTKRAKFSEKRAFLTP